MTAATVVPKSPFYKATAFAGGLAPQCCFHIQSRLRRRAAAAPCRGFTTLC